MFRQPLLSALILAAGLSTGHAARAASWQYRVNVAQAPNRDGTPRPVGTAFLWIPPQVQVLRGLFLVGQLGIEGELIVAPSVRQACADNAIGIVYFQPHVDAVFHFWEPGNDSGVRLLKALDDLADRSGHPELARVPWITAGHSTAGIYCRNVAYWKPDRVAGILHIKSGNFHQKEHIPPAGSLVGVPLLAINGQFETFGPEGGIRLEFGRETQWVFVRKDIQQFRRQDPQYLMGQAIDPGADHFHGTPELTQLAAEFIRKTAQYRLLRELRVGTAPVKVLPLKAEDGWLIDPDPTHPTHPSAPYNQYTGDKSLAMWQYDGEMAQAVADFEKNLGNDQAISSPQLTWLDDGNGYTFRAHAEWLETMPAEYGGSIGGERVGHSDTPFVYRCKDNEPVEQIGPDAFRLLRPARTVNINAFHPADLHYHSTMRWGSLSMPVLRDAQQQTITLPTPPDLKADAAPYALAATATSGLPVYYAVEYGPVIVEDGKLIVSDLPTNAQYPIPCKVTAYQIGRRIAPAIAPAPPVSV